MSKFLWAVIFAILALIFLILSIAQFKGIGLPLNNAYIWSSKEDQKTMEKYPLYRQSGIAFAICALLFLTMALECIFVTVWLWFLVCVLTVVLLIYAISSTKNIHIK